MGAGREVARVHFASGRRSLYQMGCPERLGGRKSSLPAKLGGGLWAYIPRLAAVWFARGACIGAWSDERARRQNRSNKHVRRKWSGDFRNVAAQARSVGDDS